MLLSSDFNKDPVNCAIYLLGKTINVYSQGCWLKVIIIETEAYSIDDKASHSFLGFTDKRKAMFMSPGTIYMYHSRGGPSLNVSCKGSGNAVLIKSGYSNNITHDALQIMYANLGLKHKKEITKLCSGQALLCRSLGLIVQEWDQKQFDINKFYISTVEDYKPKYIIQTTRLGINPKRDPHRMSRFIHPKFINFCSNNPIKKNSSKITLIF